MENEALVKCLGCGKVYKESEVWRMGNMHMRVGPNDPHLEASVMCGILIPYKMLKLSKEGGAPTMREEFTQEESYTIKLKVTHTYPGVTTANLLRLISEAILNRRSSMYSECGGADHAYRLALAGNQLISSLRLKDIQFETTSGYIECVSNFDCISISCNGVLIDKDLYNSIKKFSQTRE